MKNKTKYSILLLILAALVLSTWPDFHPERLVFDHYYWQVDFLLHGGFYFCVAFILLLLTKKTVQAIFISSGLVVFSVLMEGLQFFIPHRSPAWLDIASNITSILLAHICMRVFYFEPKARSINRN